MKEPLTVTALNKYLKYCFDHDSNLQDVYLKGEISNFKHHTSGHFYFTLKDEVSQIDAIMFMKNARNVQFEIKDGLLVLVKGYVSIYLQGGSYQIYVETMTPYGLGDLYLRFQQLKEKLFKEGLFDPIYKKPIPKYPKRIGVITSSTGAAIRDIITTIERRYPICEVILFPTLVQGEYAKDDIVKSIEKANNTPGIDVIILGRGGGSIEDLWCFNEEEVARAIFNSRIPIISAVGHETDFTIADFVSDLRAPTPTGAAELAVPHKGELLKNLDQTKEHLKQIIYSKFNLHHQSLRKLKSSYVFINPHRIYEQKYLKLDKLYANLGKHSPMNSLAHLQETLSSKFNRLNYAYERVFTTLNNNFTQLISKLELVNPLNVINKGYVLVKKQDKAITSINQVEVKDVISLYLKDGNLQCEVLDKEVKSYDREDI
ncbi:MAG: exodeoxyribonuclease VII large subunit, partial [Bacilli bacterium]|nr:exodeoxyribonuclease VII large subunit [Bacilli bacterium]